MNDYRFEKSMFKAWVFNHLYIAITQPEDIEFVLTNQKLQKKSKEYLVLQESIMGQGIFSIDDIKKWKHNRYAAEEYSRPIEILIYPHLKSGLKKTH